MWRIWIKYFDDKGKLCGMGYYWKFYSRKGNAERAARERYSDPQRFEYAVAQSCPW